MAINVIVIFTIALMSVVLRVLYVIYWSSKPFQTKSTKPVSTLIILGSGGHTAEMLNLLSVLQANRFCPRYYIAAVSDNMSLQKASVFENQLADKTGGKTGETAQFMRIYRSREVGQSYVTSIGTTIFAVAHALLLMMKIKPHVVLLLPLFIVFIYPLISFICGYPFHFNMLLNRFYAMALELVYLCVRLHSFSRSWD